MARGRLGGTKSKIRGKVGSQVYQCKRASDGSLMQSVYQAPENVRYSNTDAQAKARMIMGQIQRMYHILPEIIKDAFKSIPRGTLSFQHFTKLNYAQLKEECFDRFHEIGNFDWRYKHDMTAPAGTWFLTDGDYHSLQYDSLYVSRVLSNELVYCWNGISEDMTIQQVYDRFGLEITDEIWFFVYMKRHPDYTPHIEYYRYKLNNRYYPSMKVSEIILEDLWMPIEDKSITYGFTLDEENVLTFTQWNFDPDHTYFAACGCPLIVNYGYKTTRFSTARMQWFLDTGSHLYPMHSPAIAFFSWQDGEEL